MADYTGIHKDPNRPADEMDFFRWLEENQGHEAAMSYYNSRNKAVGQDKGMMDFKDPDLIEYLNKNTSSAPESKPRVIADPEQGKAATVYSTPGSAFAKTHDDLMAGGVGLKPMNYNVQPPENEEKNDIPEAYRDVDRNKEEFTPDSPLKKNFEDSGFTQYLSGYQDKANDDRLVAGLAEASTTIGTHGRAKPNDINYFRGIAENADQPMKDAMNAAKLDDQLLASKTKRDMMARSTDPNSELSKNARDAWVAVMGDEVMNKIPNFHNASAEDLKQYIDDPLKMSQMQLSRQQIEELRAGLGYGRMAQDALSDADKLKAQAEKDRLQREHDLKMQALKNQGAEDVKSTPPGGGKGAQGRPLPTGAAETISTYDAGITAINEINSILGVDGDSGVITSGVNKGLSTINLDDPRQSKLQSLIGRQLADVILALSGKAATDAERKFLKENTPSEYDRPETLRLKMKNLYDNFKSRRQAFISSQAAANFDVSGFPEAGGYVAPKDPTDGSPLGQVKGLINKYSNPSGKVIKKKLFNPKLNKTKVIYEDGTEEVVDGRK